jgi:hypothetical protein
MAEAEGKIRSPLSTTSMKEVRALPSLLELSTSFYGPESGVRTSMIMLIWAPKFRLLLIQMLTVVTFLGLDIWAEL